MAVKPGDILREKFRIDALIGRGGMGQVFAATDLRSQSQVAVKVVSRLLVDDVLMVRLHREAEAAARIRSDFVPRVVEVSDTEEGETFLVMERLIGEPLSQRIRENGALPWSEVRHIGEDILRGLVDAHAAGIVHRDLKPSNVFLALRDTSVRAMVLDFGVCKMAGLDAERLTGTGESIGTVAYMAPEQIRGAARVDERADLFAFGVLVFEMLSGCLPHEGPSQMAILASKLERAPARLSECSRVATPEGADELIMRALEREPAARFQTAQELLEAWRVLGSTTKMLPAGSSVPPRATGVTADGAEPPTEISRPPAALLALSASNEELGAVFRQGAVPSDLHPTQTALTTHHTSHRRSGGVRAAMFLASAALVAGVAVVGVSVSRGPDAAKVVPGVSVEASGALAVVSAAPAEISSPQRAGDASTGSETPRIEPSPEPALSETAAGATKSKPARLRSRPPVITPPKSSGPRITSQPRY